MLKTIQGGLGSLDLWVKLTKMKRKGVMGGCIDVIKIRGGYRYEVWTRNGANEALRREGTISDPQVKGQ